MTINQQQPAPAEHAEVFSLISNHYLPESFCTAPDGQPVWNADGLAALFGMDRDGFIALMRSRGAVYGEDPGIRSSWPMLLEAGG